MKNVENLESRVHFSAGGVDTSFGVDGQVTTPIGNSPAYSGITVLPSGKFIVAGGSTNDGKDSNSVMVQCEANGSIDRSFGENGRAPVRIGGKAVIIDAVAVAPSGGILALVTAGGGKEFLVRYSARGSRNAQFGVNGKAEMPAGVNAAQITFDGNGDVILGADYSPPLPNGEVAVDGSDSLALLRFSAGGKPDKNFGILGVVVTPFDITTWTPDIDPLADGKIMAFAQSGPGLGGGSVLRFNSDGSLDTSYGQSGITPIVPILETTTGSGSQLLAFSGVALNIAPQFQGGGSVVVAYSDGQNDPLTVSRITAQGVLDTSFGTKGLASLPFTNKPVGVFVQPNGEYLVVGNTLRSVVDQNEYDNVGIGLLTTTGSPDPTFGNDGIVINDNSPAIGASSAAIDGSRVLVEPTVISQIKLVVAAYST